MKGSSFFIDWILSFKEIDPIALDEIFFGTYGMKNDVVHLSTAIGRQQLIDLFQLIDNIGCHVASAIKT